METSGISYYQCVGNGRPKTAPGCIDHPTDTEINPYLNTQYCESIHFHQVSHQKKKKKKGFWQSMFGEQKCSQCKANVCDCKPKLKTIKIKKKDKIRFFAEDKDTLLQKGKRGVKVEKETVKTNKNCPTQCNVPINQRGVGCHLYFCIQPKKRTQNKKNKCKNNEKVKCKTETVVPKVTVICDKSNESNATCPQNLDSSKDSAVDVTVLSKKLNALKENREGLKGSPSKKSLNSDIFSPTPPVKDNRYKQPIFSDENLKPKCENIKKKANREEEALHYQRMNDRQGIYETKLRTDSDQIKRNFNKKEVDVIHTESKKNGRARFVHEPLLHSPAKGPSPNTSLTKVKRSNTNFENLSFESENLSRDFDINQKRRSKYDRRSTARSFVRNSLVTLRKEKRQSLMEGRISLILKKLSDIENKIEVIEKTKDNQSQNLTMDISYKEPSSMVSVKVLDKNCKESTNQQTSKVRMAPEIQTEKLNQKYCQLSSEKSVGHSRKQIVEKQCPVVADKLLVQSVKEINHGNQDLLKSAKPSKNVLNECVKIKSQNNQITIETPDEVNILNKTKKVPDMSKSKEVLYHNSYEMDVHIIGTNSNVTNRTVKCHNPRIILSYPDKNNENTCNSQTWRRVSEELKISEANITNQKESKCPSSKHVWQCR